MTDSPLDGPKPQRMETPGDSPTVRTPGTRYPLDEDFSAAAHKVFEACRDTHLRTTMLDWVITDQDTAKVVSALRGLSYAEIVAVIHKLGETKDGASNLLAKLYTRGIESEEQVIEWRKLLYDKFLAAAKDGQLPDLDQKLIDYQLQYVPEKVLERGF